MKEFQDFPWKFFGNFLLKKPYRWLITGVAGFIGSHLMETLLRLNQQVVGLDDFSTGLPQNLEEVLHTFPPSIRKNFTFYQDDLTNPETATLITQNVDYVLHHAALANVSLSFKNPEKTHHVNTSAFVQLLIAAEKAKVQRVIYASSSAVYGNQGTDACTEKNQVHLLSPYAASKYENEIYAQMFSRCYPLETIGLRYFNVFGPRQYSTSAYAAVIPTWIHALLENKPCYLYGDPLKTRDFCPVMNVVYANLLAALCKKPEATGHIFNVGTGKKTTLIDLFHMIHENLNLPSGPTPCLAPAREGDIAHSLADLTQSEKILGYVPFQNVSQGMAQTVEWYRKKLLPENPKNIGHSCTKC